MTYDSTEYWLAEGRHYEDRFVRTEAFEAQERALLATLAGLEFKTVLEVGCGFGRVTALIADLYPSAKITAIDLSPDQLASAKSKVDAKFIETNLADFAAGKRRWDLVIASEVLMHIPPEQVRGAVMKMKRLANRNVVTCDWTEAYADNRPIAEWNFIHDYAALYGAKAVAEKVGLQSIFVWTR